MTFLDKLLGKKKEKQGRSLSDFDKHYFLGKELGKGAFGRAKLIQQQLRKLPGSRIRRNLPPR
jgi:hypothetical protein